MACLSPEIIQQPNISHDAKKTPAPISKKLNMTPLAVSTIESGFEVAEPKASVILPHRRVKQGRAAPSMMAANEPMTIRSLSKPSANLNSEKNPTAVSSFLRVGSSGYSVGSSGLIATWTVLSCYINII